MLDNFIIWKLKYRELKSQTRRVPAFLRDPSDHILKIANMESISYKINEMEIWYFVFQTEEFRMAIELQSVATNCNKLPLTAINEH